LSSEPYTERSHPHTIPVRAPKIAYERPRLTKLGDVRTSVLGPSPSPLLDLESGSTGKFP